MANETDVKNLTASIADYQVVSLSEIVPYWRNGWDNNKIAVDVVADSIEDFSYYNPIIVDKNMTIICGHTRYKALRKLGVEQAVVMVSDLDEQGAKQYRIADNLTTSKSEWLLDRVREEYEKLPTSKTLDDCFPTIMMNQPTETALGTEETELEERHNIDDIEVELICPNCLNGIEITWGDLKRLIQSGQKVEV